MKRILTNIILIGAGFYFCLGANQTLEVLLKENLSTWSVGSETCFIIFMGFIIGMTGFMGVLSLSYFGMGKSKPARYALSRGEVIKMGVFAAGLKNEMIIYRYPFGEPMFFRFKQKELPEGGATEGWKYIWDGKKLVSVKG